MYLDKEFHTDRYCVDKTTPTSTQTTSTTATEASTTGPGANSESKKESSSWWVIIIVLLISLAVVLLLFKVWKDKHDNTANVMAQMKTHKAAVRGGFEGVSLAEFWPNSGGLVGFGDFWDFRVWFQF